SIRAIAPVAARARPAQGGEDAHQPNVAAVWCWTPSSVGVTVARAVQHSERSDVMGVASTHEPTTIAAALRGWRVWSSSADPAKINRARRLVQPVGGQERLVHSTHLTKDFPIMI